RPSRSAHGPESQQPWIRAPERIHNSSTVATKETPMTEPATQQDQPDISTLSYEQAREELVMTVKRLETGNLPLEESLRLWERGEALSDRCQSWHDGARERLDKAREETAEEGE